MRIVFFGSSHGIPEPHRRCSCVLVEIADRKYLIDAGTDPVPELINRGIQPERINAVFITHCHGDHVNGLVPFVNLCGWAFPEAEPDIYLPEMRPIDALKAWVAAMNDHVSEKIRFHEIREGEFFHDGVLKVTAMKTGHIANAYAFKLEAEGKKVLFTGDLTHNKGPIADYARFTAEETYDLAVAECAHFDATMYLEPIRRNPPKRFCLNHYSKIRLESCCRLREELSDILPLEMATDGYEIEL